MMEGLGTLIKGGHDLDTILDTYSWDRLSFIGMCVQYSEHAWAEGLFGVPKNGDDRMESRRKRLRRAGTVGPDTPKQDQRDAENYIAGIAKWAQVKEVGKREDGRSDELEATRRAFWKVD